MFDKIAEYVTAEQLMTWLAIAVLVGILIYKEWPGIKERVSAAPVKELISREVGKTLSAKIDNLANEMKEVNDKLDRDYTRLNDLEKWQRKMKDITKESAEERALMIEGILAVIDGLQQLGANGSTTKTRDKINEFINRSAHKVDEI